MVTAFEEQETQVFGKETWREEVEVPVVAAAVEVAVAALVVRTVEAVVQIAHKLEDCTVRAESGFESAVVSRKRCLLRNHLHSPEDLWAALVVDICSPKRHGCN